MSDNLGNISKDKPKKSSESHIRAQLKYYHKNQEYCDRKRYELYVKQRDTPEYKEMRRRHARTYYEKKKMMKVAQISVNLDQLD